MAIRSGDLTHRITIEMPVAVVSATTGASEPAWQAYCQCWAKVTPTTGSERFVSQQWVGTSSHIVQLRFQRGITSAMRVVYYSAVPGESPLKRRILRVNQVQDFREEHAETIIACTEEDVARV